MMSDPPDLRKYAVNMFSSLGVLQIYNFWARVARTLLPFALFQMASHQQWFDEATFAMGPLLSPVKPKF
jgi:hypothetical protein